MSRGENGRACSANDTQPLDTAAQTTAALGADWATQAGTEQNTALLPLLKPTILQASAWDHFLIHLSHYHLSRMENP